MCQCVLWPSVRCLAVRSICFIVQWWKTAGIKPTTGGLLSGEVVTLDDTKLFATRWRHSRHYKSSAFGLWGKEMNCWYFKDEFKGYFNRTEEEKYQQIFVIIHKRFILFITSYRIFLLYPIWIFICCRSHQCAATTQRSRLVLLLRSQRPAILWFWRPKKPDCHCWPNGVSALSRRTTWR